MNTIAMYPRSLCGLDSVSVFQPAPVVAVRCVCVQEAEAARTLQAQGTTAGLQRQLVSGTRRAQHGGLCALCADFSAVRVLCAACAVWSPCCIVIVSSF
jgi:hypothetical protein